MEALRGFTALAAFLLVLVWTGAARGEKSGKEIFLEQKCAKCHSIQSQGIVKSEEKDEGGEDEFAMEEEEGEKVEPPDLSGTGKKRDPDWLTKWIQKKIENEEERKHRERFKGSEGDLKTLVEFLSGLKEERSGGGK